MTREQALILLRAIADAVLETVREMGPTGAPAGPMYAAFQTRGLSLETFQQVTDALVAAGKVRRAGHVYYAV